MLASWYMSCSNSLKLKSDLCVKNGIANVNVCWKHFTYLFSNYVNAHHVPVIVLSYVLGMRRTPKMNIVLAFIQIIVSPPLSGSGLML